MEDVQQEIQIPRSRSIPKTSAEIPQNETSTTHIYDTIVIGFSTIGLSLAVALSDLTLDTLQNILFVERSPKFTATSFAGTWTFAQDLATSRCPTSPYTFLNYLSEKGSLQSFLFGNSLLLPSEEEWKDYLQWAAEQFSELVRYGEEIAKVEVVSDEESSGNLWVVTMRNTQIGENRMLVCKNLILGTGEEARIVESNGIQEDYILEQMRESCIPRSCSDGFAQLAVQSGKVATALLFGDEGTSARAIL